MRNDRLAQCAKILLSGLVIAGCTNSAEPSGANATALEALTPTILTGTAGFEVQPAPSVRVVDRGGNPVEGVEIDFVFFVDLSAGRTLIRTVRAQSGNDGTATVTWTLGTRTGVYTIAAKSAGLPTVEFTATADAGPISEIRRLTSPQIGTPGLPLLHPLSVLVADRFDNPIAGAAVTFTVISGGGTIEGGPVSANASGIATSGPWTLGPTIGEQAVKAQSANAEVTLTALGRVHSGEPTGQLAFVRNNQIYRVNLDGTRLLQLTHDGENRAPAWSPDGERIAYSRVESGYSGDVYLMDADGSSVVRRTTGSRASAPAWSPDGRRIAFGSWGCAGGQGCIVVVNADGGDSSELRLGNPVGYNGTPTWSPDGRKIAFVSDADAYDFVYDIYVSTVEGAAIGQLTRGFGMWPQLTYSLHPVWSPDGARIAFVYGSVIPFPVGMRFNVAVMNSDGSGRRDVTWAGDIPWSQLLDPGSLSWSPDGSKIAYSFVDCDMIGQKGCTSSRSIKYVAVDGGEQGTLVADASEPSWHAGPRASARR